MPSILMYKSYITPLQKLLLENADSKVKEWREGFVKQSAPFLGVKMLVIRTSLHQWPVQTKLYI